MRDVLRTEVISRSIEVERSEVQILGTAIHLLYAQRDKPLNERTKLTPSESRAVSEFLEILDRLDVG